MIEIPLTKSLYLGTELEYLNKAILNGSIRGNGVYSQKCINIIKNLTCGYNAYMTPSCSLALDAAALILDIKSGDEIIIPSFTFPATVAPFIRQGAKIKWCDIRKDTKNINEKLIESLITDKTKAIVIVHYGGWACELDIINKICHDRKIMLVEDCAHSFGSYYNDRFLGSFGDLSVFSFHATKNIHCGEGGALVINNPDLLQQAEMIIFRGTDQIKFIKGEIDHYSWQVQGSNYLMSELQAAFLYAQMKQLDMITENHFDSWNIYYNEMNKILPKEYLPPFEAKVKHNAHIFYILTENTNQQKLIIKYLKNNGIEAAFHYIPLHKAPFWKNNYQEIELPITEDISSRIVRLPIYYNMNHREISYVVDNVKKFYEK